MNRSDTGPKQHSDRHAGKVGGHINYSIVHTRGMSTCALKVFFVPATRPPGAASFTSKVETLSGNDMASFFQD